ncbi:MAG TPA: hypothetical protein VGJ70_26585 [Solirubrobacteraceae bacterium]
MRVRRRRRRVAAALAPLVAAGLVAAPSAWADRAGSVTASGGPVRATLSWKAADLGVSDPRLVIARSGATAFSGSPFGSRSACAQGGCSLLPSGRRSSPLQVRDLDGDGDPEVLVDAFTGGAHCCATTVVLRRDAASGTYAPRELEWGNAGYELRDPDRDGTPEFVTMDDVFAGAFTAYAASISPIKVAHFDPARRTGLAAVTRRFPALVRADLARIQRRIRSLRRQHIDLRGAIAAEVAEQYLLGRARTARRTLDAHLRRGDVRPRRAGPAFRRHLLRFLHRHGYR